MGSNLFTLILLTVCKLASACTTNFFHRFKHIDHAVSPVVGDATFVYWSFTGIKLSIGYMPVENVNAHARYGSPFKQ